MDGIEIKIDNLGRLVIPIKYRRKLGVSAKDKLLVSLRESTLVISLVMKLCALCKTKLSGKEKIALCLSCLLKAREMKIE